MKKIIALPLALSFFMAKSAFAADEIHWTVTGQNSVTVNWRGSNTENIITYGLPSGSVVKAVASHPQPMPYAAQGTFWEAKLTGLKENSTYSYVIGNGSKNSFRTPVARGSADFSVYAEGIMGDTSHHVNMGGVQELIAKDILANRKPALVVGLGDLSLGSLNGQAAVHQHFNDVMAWSKNTAYMPVWGDYDVRSSKTDNFSNYKGRFNLPNPQSSPNATVAGSEDWYWYDYGNTRFITLPEPTAGAWTDWQTKANKFMAQAQAAARIKFIVTFVHRPAYSSGHYAGSTALKGILDGLGDRYSKYVLNVNSHSANYERSHPQHGVVHITAGTGGKSLMQDGGCLWLTCAKPAWSAYRAMHLGALKLSFTATGINGSFICGPSGSGINDVQCTKGSVIDKFTIKAKSVSPIVAATSSQPATQLALTGAPSAMQAVASTTSCTKIALSLSGLIKDGGVGYRVNKKFGIPADTNTSRTRSKLRLFENGVEIGPAHSYHYEVRNSGAGRFAHWSYLDGTGESLRFSATNNTNPSTNGKAYSYCIDSGTTASGDTAAPAVPGSMKAVAASSSQINLSWTKPTDNVGVTGYKIYKNGVLLTTTSNVSYSATGLAAGTAYSFYVTAYDAAGNVSTKSATVSATTTAATSTAPPATSCAPAPTSSLVVNVKSKGALGNGTANDTAAIQAAIVQVGGTGGTVYVPDGTYRIDVTKRLILRSNMTFRMSNNAVLKAIGTSAGETAVLMTYSGTPGGANNINIIGGTVEGERFIHSGTSGQWGHAVSIWGGKNIVVENVTAKNAWGDGFYVSNDPVNVALCSVTADKNRRHGMSITSGNGIVVKNSVFKNTDGFDFSMGIDVEPNAGEYLNNVQILNSQLLSNRASGLQAVLNDFVQAAGGSMSNLVVQGNTLANNASRTDGTQYSALKFARQTGAKLLNNSIKNNNHSGVIIVEDSKNNTVSGNTITDNGTLYSPSQPEGYGILVYGGASRGNTITNNVLSRNNINIKDWVGGNNISGNTMN